VDQWEAQRASGGKKAPPTDDEHLERLDAVAENDFDDM
jgi:hypothetical protein